jgi:hypothetical protein
MWGCGTTSIDIEKLKEDKIHDKSKNIYHSFSTTNYGKYIFKNKKEEIK